MWVNDCGIDDIWMGDLDGIEVRIQRMAEKDSSGMKDFKKLFLDILKGGCDWLEHFLRNTRIPTKLELTKDEE